jgi:hypothetical protein
MTTAALDGSPSRYETEDAARKARDLIAKALVGAISL